MNSENKRKHERIQSLNLSYICLDEDNNIIKQGMGRTLNISEAGILLETHFPIELNHTIRLTISLEENLLDIIGRPVHVQSIDGGKYQVGIQFADLDETATKTLRDYISSGETSASSEMKEGK